VAVLVLHVAGHTVDRIVPEFAILTNVTSLSGLRNVFRITVIDHIEVSLSVPFPVFLLKEVRGERRQAERMGI
jgi:hypothetical protein